MPFQVGQIISPVAPVKSFCRGFRLERCNQSATQDTVITFAPSVLAANPQLEGVQITVPANSLFSDNGTRGGRVGIAPVAGSVPEPLRTRSSGYYRPD